MPMTVMAPGALIAQGGTAEATTPLPATPGTTSGSGVSGTGEVPEWAHRMVSSDMNGLGPDGKPDPDYKANGTGHSRLDFNHDPAKPHLITLSREEQDIWKGKRIVTVDLLGDDFLEAVNTGDPIKVYSDGTVEIG